MNDASGPLEGFMHHQWRDLEIFLPSRMTSEEVRHEVRSRILVTAAEGGEFVHAIRICGSKVHAEGWTRWRVVYRPGPAGLRKLRYLAGGGPSVLTIPR